MKSMILGSYWDEISAGADEYASLHGSSWASSESSVGSVVSTAGTLRNLRIKLVDGSGQPISPGSGRHHIFMVRKNGADTELTVTISDLETEGNDLTHEVAVAAGDRINLKKVHDADYGADCYVRWVTEFEGDTANESILFSMGTVLHYYLDKFGGWVSGFNPTGEDEARQICAVAGTIRNFYISLSQAPDPGGVDGYILTIRKNGGDTSITVEIKGDETTGYDATHSVAVVAGDIITIGQTRTATGNPATNVVVYYGTTFVATTDGEVPLPFGSYDALNAGATEYSYVSHHTVWTAEEYKRKQYATPCYLDWLYVTVSAAPGAGKSWVFTIMKNGVATDLWVIITGTDTSSYKSVDPEVRVNLGDELTLRCVPSGTPAAAYAFGGLRSLWRTVALPEVVTKSATSIAVENATWGATLNGSLIDDGTQDCEVRFQYGLDTDYGTDTGWVSQAEGDFSLAITGLTANTIYHFRAQAKNASGTVSGVDMEFGTYEQIYPTVATTRVTGLIHRWSPGNYTLEVTLGGVITEFGIPQFTIAPAPSMPTTPYVPPGPTPPDVPPPVVITCPEGYEMRYDSWDIYKQHPYCAEVREPAPEEPVPGITYQYCQQLYATLEQGRQAYMAWAGISYISLDDYARTVGLWDKLYMCRILYGGGGPSPHP